MKPLSLVIAGLVGIVAIALLCLRSIPAVIEQELNEQATAALAAAGKGWATVEANGQRIILSGRAPDAESRKQAEVVVADINGVTAVENRLTITAQSDDSDRKRLLEIRAPKRVMPAERSMEPPVFIKRGVIRQAHKEEAAASPEPDFSMVAADVAGAVDSDRDSSEKTHEPISEQQPTAAMDDTVESEAPPQPVETEERVAGEEELLAMVDESASEEAQQPSAENEQSPVAMQHAARMRADRQNCQNQFDRLLMDRKIHFNPGSAGLSARSRGLLDQLAGIARTCPRLKIEIAGHTDRSGSSTQNQNLSENRAQSVYWALAKRGIAIERLAPVGYGAAFPVASNETAEGRARNRRIEFTVKEK